MYHNQKVHKAKHSGYKKKITKAQAKANLDFWNADGVEIKFKK